MTRKDYKLIAAQIAATRRDAGDAEKLAIDRLTANLARALWRDNERFQPVTFLLACGVPESDLLIS